MNIPSFGLRVLAVTVPLFGCAPRQEAGTPPQDTHQSPLAREQSVPLIDHHQHLVSPGTAEMVSAKLGGGQRQTPLAADGLIALLDSAGIRRAVVLSNAFTFGGRNFDRDTHSEDELYALVRAENDWTAAEVARYPDRLIAFCSFHPQAPHALPELRRCAANPRFKGVKLHLEESDVDLTDPRQADKVRQVFAEANRLRLPIAIHYRNNRVDALANTQAFLTGVLPAAPDVPVQVAHLFGGGTYSEPALALLADAVASGTPATRRLIFDLTDVALTPRAIPNGSAAVMQRMVDLMRRIGIGRMVYGSDPAVFGRPAPREGWAEFRKVMPLSEEEVRLIANNVAPYLR
jgi:predicted TIM-barrel fold metal-dependent hydrolase